jgi:predicted nucleic acid-binding protein
MILVDTSLWVDHFRKGDSTLTELLQIPGEILTHPWVIAELALGGLSETNLLLQRDLPQATVATDHEVLLLITQEQLAGTGIGYVDSQLLAATRLTAGSTLWTKDSKLSRVAERLGVDYQTV